MNASNFFENKGFVAAGFLNLTANDAYYFCNKGAYIVDIRIPEISGFKQFNVPKVMNIPFKELENRKQSIPCNTPLIIADSTGVNCRKAMQWFLENKFNNIANLAGGFVEWEREKLPIITNIKNRLSGSCVCQLKNRNI